MKQHYLSKDKLLVRITSIFLVTLHIVLFPVEAFSQPCLPEGVTFTTQEEIDNFQTNHPGCTEIEGNVLIEGNDISNLNGLSVVNSIEGSILIGGTEAMDSLTGLDNVTFIGGNLNIGGNDGLISLTGLENLITIEGDLNIGTCGFGGCSGNSQLQNLSGLDNLTSIGGDFNILANYSLVNFNGLESLNSVGGNLMVGKYGPPAGCYGNPSLLSFSGMESLSSIGGEIDIWCNDTLTSLSGLENIDPTSISNLTIRGNNSLGTCEVQSICDYLGSPNGTVVIMQNAVGCNNPPEISNACGNIQPCLPYGNYHFLTQNEIDNFQNNYPECTQLKGDIYISGDDINNLNGLSVITSLEGNLRVDWNPHLISLAGLDNIDAGSIDNLRITYNTSLSECDVQSVCDFLASYPYNASIYTNATGCNSSDEVQDSCLTTSVQELGFDETFTISPNPLESTSVINYIIPYKSPVTIKIIDLAGQIIKTLVNELQQHGEQKLIFNTGNLPAGIYFCVLKTNNGIATKKIIKL